jgi:hypothetical protein
MLGVSIGSPNPSGGLFLSPEIRKEVKKLIPPPISSLEDRLEQILEHPINDQTKFGGQNQ